MENTFYHGTFCETPIINFKYAQDDIGFHFGTLNQAKTRIHDKSNKLGYIYKYHLNINNSLRLPDLSNFNYKTILHQLIELKFKNINQIKNNIRSNSDMRNYLSTHNIDSIIYLNEKEVLEANDLIIENNKLSAITKSSKDHPLYKEYKIVNQRLNLVIQYFAEDSILVLSPSNIKLIPHETQVF